MIKFNITFERKSALTDKEKQLLAEVYGKLWMEAHYDPDSEQTQKFSAPLSDKMQELNKTLKFKE